MDDPSPYPDIGNDAGVRPDRETTPGTPRWVKVFAIVALIVILLVIILVLTGGGPGGGGHGPNRH